MAYEDGLREARDRLTAEWGIHARRVRALARGLAGQDWQSVRDLVEAHGVSRREAQNALRRLEPWLERDGERVRLADPAGAAKVFGCDAPAPPPDPYETLAAEHPDVVAFMAEALDGLAPPVQRLDHVSVTPATAVKRALLLTTGYDLAGASVLCLGDHDLTSLALLRLRPDLDVTVVDVDEDVLAQVGRVARARGWTVRTVFADLRVELPTSLTGRFDLVFTDQPYTPEGTRLFLARGLASLRQADTSRILCCYGFGERHPALGLKIQDELTRLRLVAEAILPGFNRYHGAEAIGSRSALYVCRPTSGSWAAAERAAAITGPRIYTHGPESVEARPQQLPDGLARDVRKDLGEAVTIVGEGWPATVHALPLSAYLRDRKTRRGKPPFTRGPHEETVAVSLLPSYGGYLARILLLAGAARLVLVTAAKDDQLTRLADLLDSVCEVTVRNRDGLAIVTATRALPPAEPVSATLRDVIDHPHATLGSAWREALIRTASVHDRNLTKNEARSLIAATDIGRSHAASHLAELPLDALSGLAAAVRSTVSAAT
ncbi:MAG: bis-aminopropyl spermidine synthase family protein [Egibacteraceae bacterium]